MPTTYTPIATTTLGSAASTITFSSIPNTYTDLRVILNIQLSAGSACRWRFNSDTSTNYSFSVLYGDGSSAGSGKGTSQTYCSAVWQGSVPTSPNWGLVEIDIFSYAGSTNKTCLSKASMDVNGSGTTEEIVSLWRSTSAIDTITFITGGGINYSTGTTATLYGITKA